jgi:hypothetical protein
VRARHAAPLSTHSQPASPLPHTQANVTARRLLLTVPPLLLSSHHDVVAAAVAATQGNEKGNLLPLTVSPPAAIELPCSHHVGIATTVAADEPSPDTMKRIDMWGNL